MAHIRGGKGREDDVSAEGHPGRRQLTQPHNSTNDNDSDYDNEALANRLFELYPVLLPPLRLHSPKGRELDTDSQLQRNIRLAKLCHLLGLPEFIHDWKLPKTHIPSRPDFSRNTYQMSHRHTDRPMPMIAEDQVETVTQSHYHIEVSDHLLPAAIAVIFTVEF